MGSSEVGQFLTHLATERHVSASTQNQALAALLFLYKSVLGIDIGLIDGVVRAKRPRRLPVVLTLDEVKRLFSKMEGVVLLVCQLLYGSGLRLIECLNLRVKDIDFERNEIVVRDGKGSKDRITMLPVSIKQKLTEHLEHVRRTNLADLRRGLGHAPLPEELFIQTVIITCCWADPKVEREAGLDYMKNLVGIIVAVVGGFTALWLHDWWNRRLAEKRLATRPQLTPGRFGQTYFGEQEARARLAGEVREILSHHVPYSLDGLQPADQFIAHLRMDELDSMATVEVVLELEKRYAIEIPDSDAEALHTVGELVDYLDRRLNGDARA
jgi:acyl carrier protein